MIQTDHWRRAVSCLRRVARAGRYSGLVGLCSIIAAIFLLAEHQGSQSSTADIPKFAKVNEFVYRSGQPSEVGFRQLARLGIKTVVDLRGAGERSPEEKALVESHAMRYVKVPMSGWHRPKDEEISHVLEIITDPTNHPVLVHCRRGAERTGVVVAIYRILIDGWDGERAYREMRRFGFPWYMTGMKQCVFDYAKRRDRKAPRAGKGI